MKRKTAKKVTAGSLINKLERNIALANMRGDKVAAASFAKMLAAAVNSTKMPEVCV